MGLFISAASRHDDFRVADGGSAYTRNDHQAVTIRAKLRHGLFPDGEVAGWIIVATIEDTLLLLRFAFYQVSAAIRAERARLNHHRPTIAALWKARTGNETSKASGANHQVAPAVRTSLVPSCNRLLPAVPLGPGLFHRHLKIPIELAQELYPRLPAPFQIIQPALHISP